MSQPTLSVERLFSDPPLNTPLPAQVRFSPDGQSLSFLKLADDDRDRLDLWLFDCRTHQARCLLNPDRLGSGELSAADKERLERQRQFVGGVTGYDWFPDASAVLVMAGGRSWRIPVDGSTPQELAAEAVDKGVVRLSPQGRYLSYVRAGDLFVYDLSAGVETRVTDDADDQISNGTADFIAQEEMHRFTGHWWSADEQEIVFCKNDLSPIPLVVRQEIHADGVKSVSQRYPYAGGPNAQVTLWRYNLSNSNTQACNLPLGEEDYLARVQYLKKRLVVQVQDRPQQHLKLLVEENGAWQVLREEKSETWVNLHDNLLAVDDERYLWTSEINGLSALYLCTIDGAQQQISPDDMHVVEVLACDRAETWVLGWRDNPCEQHLFRIGLEAEHTVEQLTERAGWHQAKVHLESGRWVDVSTDVHAPPSIQLHASAETAAVFTPQAWSEHPYGAFIAQHVTPTFGNVAATDGSELHYRLTPPANLQEGQTYPVVVYVYGGPGAQKVRNEWPPLLLQLFAQSGYGVFELDNRGSTNRGRHFEAAIYQSMGDAEVADQLAGVAALTNYAWVDPSRIGVFGHSYGGFMTVMCLCKAPDVFRAGVSVAPVSDWRLYDTHYTERYLGNPAEDDGPYERSSVFPYLEQLASPLLLMHGMADDNVLFTHTTKLMDALQRLNKPFELMTYPGSKHALQERHVSIHRFGKLLEFFDRVL